MAGLDSVGAVLAPVAGAGVAIAVAIAIPGDVAVLGTVPVLVGVAVGGVVAFTLGYTVGDRGYLMVGGPALHILVGGAAVAGLVGSQLVGFAVAGVGGVGLLLFVVRVYTGNLRRHAALPANPSAIRTLEARVAKWLMGVRSVVRRIGARFVGRLALGGVWIVTTTGLLWTSAAIAAGLASVPGVVPPETLSLVPASGYLVALFAPFFVWTDWLGLEGLDPEARETTVRRTTGTVADEGSDGEPVEDGPDATGDPTSPATREPAADDAGEADTTATANGGPVADDGPPSAPAEPGTADAEGENAGTAEATADTEDPATADDESETATSSGNGSDDYLGFADADPEELWTPGFGEEVTDRDGPRETLDVPGIDGTDSDDDRELWGGAGTDTSDDAGSGSTDEEDPAPTPLDAGIEDLDGTGEPPDGSRPAENRDPDRSGTDGTPDEADGERPDDGADAGPAPAGGADAGSGDREPSGPADDGDDVTPRPGDRVRTYKPHVGGSEEDPATDGDDDSIQIFGPEDDEAADDGEDAAESPSTVEESGSDDGGGGIEEWPNPEELSGTASDPATGDAGSDPGTEDATSDAPAEDASVREGSESVGDEADTVEPSPDRTSEGTAPAEDPAAVDGTADDEVGTDAGDEVGTEKRGGGSVGSPSGEDGESTEVPHPGDEESMADPVGGDDDGSTAGEPGSIDDDGVDARDDQDGVDARDDQDGVEPPADGEPETVAEANDGSGTSDGGSAEEGAATGSSVPEPTRPPVDTDAVEATTDERDDPPEVSRGRPVGVRGVDAASDDSTDRRRERRGQAPRTVDESRDVSRDGSPAVQSPAGSDDATGVGTSDDGDGEPTGDRTAETETEGGERPTDDGGLATADGEAAVGEVLDGDVELDDEVTDDEGSSGVADDEGVTDDESAGDEEGIGDDDAADETVIPPSEDRSVTEITDSIENDLEEIVSDEDDERLQDVGPVDEESAPDDEIDPDDEVTVADRVSSILSGEDDVDPEHIEKGTAEEIAEILDDEDDEDDDGT